MSCGANEEDKEKGNYDEDHYDYAHNPPPPETMRPALTLFQEKALSLVDSAQIIAGGQPPRILPWNKKTRNKLPKGNAPRTSRLNAPAEQDRAEVKVVVAAGSS